MATPQQLATFANLTPQQQAQLTSLTPQQRAGLPNLAQQNLPAQGLSAQGFGTQAIADNGFLPQAMAGTAGQMPTTGGAGSAPVIPGQQSPFQTGATPTGAPPTGLIGSELAIQQGLGSQLGLLAQGIGSAQGEIDIATGRAIEPLQGFTQQGQQAGQQQAALSGALGPEAQQQAFQAFTQSPGQEFAIEQGRLATLKSAAATQGLGGGNVLRELNRQGIGQAQQNFQQEFNNLGTVANRGFQGAGAQAAIQERGGANLSNLALQGGVLPAQAVGSAAGQLAQGRFGVGQLLAQAAQGITTGQANLQSQQGSGLSNIFGQGSTNLANLTAGTGTQSAQLQQNLATLLANIGTGTGTNVAQFTNIASQFDAGGTLGQNTAVQNTLSQLLQLIPQGGAGAGGGGSTFNTFGGFQTPTTTPAQSGTFLSGTTGQQVA